MARYRFELVGLMPLLMHADDVAAQDLVKEWRATSKGKKSAAGDDRAPGWLWQTYLYKGDDGHVCIPQGNLMPTLRAAASQITLKKMKSFKEMAVRSIVIEQEYCEFFTYVDGKPAKVSLAPLQELHELPFKEQFDAVKKLGFTLDVRRAAVGTSKHVRVRPRFRNWMVKGTLRTTDDSLTPEIMAQIFEGAGYQGLGDWRPSSKKAPGPYGTFEAKLTVEK